MKTLREVLKDAEDRRIAVGHFNVSDLVLLKAVFTSARELNVPVLVGVSEGEREFMGVLQIVALVKSLRFEESDPGWNDHHSYQYGITCGLAAWDGYCACQRAARSCSLQNSPDGARGREESRSGATAIV
jgi:fructose-bisphosphate aldolase, class II